MNKVLNVGALVMDERLQSRTEISEETVADYADALKDGAEFPPVLVYFDGVNYYLTDGYHRAQAHKRAEKVSILCDVVQGTLRDAILHSTGVNAKHGMRRTYADKRKAVMTLLDDFEWSQWSSSEIARRCGVSPTFVSSLRESGAPSEVKYKKASGEVAVKAKAPGRPAKEKEPELKEPAKQEPVKNEESFDPRDELIEHLTKENEELTVNLALAHMGGTEAEQSEAREIINSLREEIRVLKIELVSVKQSRDTFQQENSQLKQQCASYARQLKKVQS